MAEDPAPGVDGNSRRLRPVKSLVRAIDLLDVLAVAGASLGLTELAAATGFSKTATYNLITTLETRGLIRRDGGNRYGLGWRLLELGEVVRTRSSLGEVARAHVSRLAELAGETAFVAILDGDTVLCVEMAESRRSVPILLAPGRRVALDDNAAGQVLLAFASVRRRRRYAQTRLGAVPDAGVIARLDAVRHAGHAMSGTDGPAELACVAVPVLDDARAAVAALALTGPRSRLTGGRMLDLLAPLAAEAAEVSRALGSRAVAR